MIDFNSFQDALPADVFDLLGQLNAFGFKTGIVGGIPRDFLGRMKMGRDFDVELRPKSEEGFMALYESLPKMLQDRGLKTFEKGYKVFEVALSSASVEFTLPRVEVFKNEIGHSNFTARHIADLDYARGFLRRDFTVNAIMFELEEGCWRLVDPLNGMGDLKARLLRACDNGLFVKDPVRFLRAARFCLKEGLAFDPVLSQLLKNMPLAISAHYLKSEALKSERPLSFLLLCQSLRPDEFSFYEFTRFEQQIKEYESLFRLEESSNSNILRSHIHQALFLPAKTRKAALKTFGFSDKGALELDLKEVNLSKIKSLDVQELSRVSWIRPFMDFVSKMGDFGDKKLRWLLQEEGAEFELEFLRRFGEAKGSCSKEASPSIKKAEIFQSKLKTALKNS